MLPLPRLQLETLFILDQAGRIIATREPGGDSGPRFALVRGATSCAFAVRSDVPQPVLDEIVRLAGEEPPTSDFTAEPVHVQAYRDLVGGSVRSGPAFTFPQVLAPSEPVAEVEAEGPLGTHFRGWTPGEIAAGRRPVMAVLEDGVPVSVCFCARRSSVAAEAGLETAPAFRRRGFGARTTAAWASAVRAEGLVPLYSTSWDNTGSLAVARKLALVPFASDWRLSDRTPAEKW